jgi:hypothetical protein
MKTMSWFTIFKAFVFVCIGLVVGAALSVSTGGIYSLGHVSEGDGPIVAFRINKFTGKTWYVVGNRQQYKSIEFRRWEDIDEAW